MNSYQEQHTKHHGILEWEGILFLSGLKIFWMKNVNVMQLCVWVCFFFNMRYISSFTFREHQKHKGETLCPK